MITENSTPSHGRKPIAPDQQQAVRLLLVDDEQSYREPLAGFLHGQCGCQVIQAETADDVRKLLTSTDVPFHIVLLDDLLTPAPRESPKAMGLELAKEIRTVWPNTAVILYTGWEWDRHWAKEALQAGVYRVLRKPVQLEELQAIVDHLAEHQRLREQVQEKEILARMAKLSRTLFMAPVPLPYLVRVKAVLEQIKALGFDRVRLYRFDNEAGALEALAQVGMEGQPAAAFAGLRIPKDSDPYLRRLLKAHGTLVFNEEDRRSAPQQPPGFAELGVPDVPEWACVPLYYEGQFVGKIVLDNYDRQAPIDRALLRPVELFSAQLAALIAYEDLLRQWQHRGHLLEALNDAARHIRAERDPDRLLHEIVRQGARVLGCQVAALWVNRPESQMVELVALYNLQDVSLGLRSSYNQGLAGVVAIRGEKVRVSDYTAWSYAHPAFKCQPIYASLGVPIRNQEGEIELVLCVGFTEPNRTFTPLDEDMAQRFAEQASIAWNKALFIGEGARHVRRVQLLNQFHGFIETCENEQYIYHALATCVSAEFGLRFNRVALFCWNDRERRLEGVLGIGHLTLAEAEEHWNNLERQGSHDFASYAERLRDTGIEVEPFHGLIQGMILPVDMDVPSAEEDALSQILRKRRPSPWTPDQVQSRLPAPLVDAFKPTTPLLFAPLVAGETLLGLLVADNKFTEAPVTDEILATLANFTGTAAVVLDNLHTRREAEQTARRLQAFLEGNRRAGQGSDPEHVLERMLDHVRQTLEADQVFAVLYHPKYGAYQSVARSLRDGQELPSISEIVRPHGLTHKVFRSRKPMVHHYPEPDEAGHKPHPFFGDIRTALGVPMHQGDRVLGVLWIQYRNHRVLNRKDEQVAQLLVDQVASAYENVQGTHRVRTMHAAVEALSGANSAHDTLQTVVDYARELLQANSSVLYVYDQSASQFDYTQSVYSGLTDEEWRQLQGTTPELDAVARRVLSRGWLEVPDVAETEDWLDEGTRHTLERIGVCSFVGLALHGQEGPLGVLYVNHQTYHPLGEAERAWLESLARHAAAALERVRLLERLQQIHKASRRVAELTTQERLEQTLEEVVSQVKTLLRAHAVTLYSYEEDFERLNPKPVAIGVRYPERMRSLSVVDPRSIVYRMMERRTPYFVTDVAQDRLFRKRRFTREEKIHSLATLPLWVHDHPVGVLFVNYRNLHDFTGAEKEDLLLLGHQAAVAIRAVQMRDRLRERAQMLKQLTEAARTISATFHAQEILETAVRTAATLTGAHGPTADIALIALVDDQEPGTLVFRAAQPPELLPGLIGGTGRIRLTDDPRRGITGRAFLTGEAQLVPDVRDDKDYISVDQEIRSELAVPIVLGGRRLGVLDVESYELNAFDYEDQEGLELLAAEVAVALENARRYREIQETKGLAGQRTVLAWMGLADNVWRHTNAKQARMIQETTELVERTLGRLLPSVPADAQDTALRQRLQAQLVRIREAASAIESKPTLPKVDPATTQRVEVVSLVRERVMQMRQDPKYRAVHFCVPSFKAAYTRGQAEWLRQTLDMLVDNAVEAVREQEQPDVQVSLALKSSWVEIQVSDNGPGLPPEVVESLGRTFVEKSEDAKGLGIGLVLTQMILEAYGGRLRVVKTNARGATMALTLPLYSD